MSRRLFDVLWPLSWILATLGLLSACASAQGFRKQRVVVCEAGQCRVVQRSRPAVTHVIKPTVYRELGQQNTQLVQIPRQVTHYRTVTRCDNGVCRRVSEPYTVTELVWVRTASEPKQATKTTAISPTETPVAARSTFGMAVSTITTYGL